MTTTEKRTRRFWKLHRHDADHCPGGCYWFRAEPSHPDGTFHVPVNMFWGRTSWVWF